MINMELGANMGGTVDVDVCKACQAMWFDKYESLKLAPASTLKLIKMIGEYAETGSVQYRDAINCPRCRSGLLVTNDLQRNTRFSYWRCGTHGRFIRFHEFLREKNFIRPLSPQEIHELRKNIQFVNCSNCGAPVDLANNTPCSHCGSPVSMLDMQQPERLIKELTEAAERPVASETELIKRMAIARLEAEKAFSPVQIDIRAIARWLNTTGF